MEEKCFHSPTSRSISRGNITKIITAKDNDEIIGYIHFREKDDEKEVYVRQVCVDPNLRQKGIGTNLYKSLFEYESKKGFCHFTGHIRESNVESLNLHNKLNFEETEIIPGYYSNGEDAIFVKKSIC